MTSLYKSGRCDDDAGDDNANDAMPGSGTLGRRKQNVRGPKREAFAPETPPACDDDDDDRSPW